VCDQYGIGETITFICSDIDGVLADPREYIYKYLTGKADWKEYFKHTLEFLPIRSIIDLLRGATHYNARLFIVTGRPESNRVDTTCWLMKHLCRRANLYPARLYMRKDGDPRGGTEIKLEWYRELKPDLVIDDCSDTVDAAVNAGYTALLVKGFRATVKETVPENY